MPWFPPPPPPAVPRTWGPLGRHPQPPPHAPQKWVVKLTSPTLCGLPPVPFLPPGFKPPPLLFLFLAPDLYVFPPPPSGGKCHRAFHALGGGETPATRRPPGGSPAARNRFGPRPPGPFFFFYIFIFFALVSPPIVQRKIGTPLGGPLLAPPSCYCSPGSPPNLSVPLRPAPPQPFSQNGPRRAFVPDFFYQRH